MQEIWSVDSQVNYEVVATRCKILGQKCTKFDLGWGSAPNPTRETYRAPQIPSCI